MDFFEQLLSILKTIQFRDVVDILAIALIIFGLFRLVRETRAIQLLKGILVLAIIYFFASLFQLVMLSSLLRVFFEASVVVIAVIFQPEIRKALEQVGRNKNWKKYLSVFSGGFGLENAPTVPSSAAGFSRNPAVRSFPSGLSVTGDAGTGFTGSGRPFRACRAFSSASAL